MNAREFLEMIDFLCPIPGADEPIRLGDERPERGPSRAWAAAYGVGDDPNPYWEEEE